MILALPGRESLQPNYRGPNKANFWWYYKETAFNSLNYYGIQRDSVLCPLRSGLPVQVAVVNFQCSNPHAEGSAFSPFIILITPPLIIGILGRILLQTD